MKDIKMDLLERLHRLYALLHRAMHHRHKQPEMNPHRGQGRVLALLTMQKEITQKELSYLLDIRNQSLGELLSKLEKADLVTREPSESDRRMMVVRLTEKGEQEAKKIDPASANTGDLFGALSQEEQETLCQLLSKLIDSMEAQLGSMDDGPFGHGRSPRGPRGFFGRGGRGMEYPPFDPRMSHGMDPRMDPRFARHMHCGPMDEHMRGGCGRHGHPQYDATYDAEGAENTPFERGPHGSHGGRFHGFGDNRYPFRPDDQAEESDYTADMPPKTPSDDDME